MHRPAFARPQRWPRGRRSRARALEDGLSGYRPSRRGARCTGRWPRRSRVHRTRPGLRNNHPALRGRRMGGRCRWCFRRSWRRGRNRRRRRGRMPHRWRSNFSRRRWRDWRRRRLNRRFGCSFNFRLNGFRLGNFRLGLGGNLGRRRNIPRRWWCLPRHRFRGNQPWCGRSGRHRVFDFRLGWRRRRSRPFADCRSFRRMAQGLCGRRWRLRGCGGRSCGTGRHGRPRRGMCLHLLADRLQHVSRLGDMRQIEFRLNLVFCRMRARGPSGRSLRLRLSGIVSPHLLRFFH